MSSHFGSYSFSTCTVYGALISTPIKISLSYSILIEHCKKLQAQRNPTQQDKWGTNIFANLKDKFVNKKQILQTGS